MSNREEFEKWWSSFVTLSYDMTRTNTDDLNEDEITWIAWQAACELNDKEIAKLRAELKDANEQINNQCSHMADHNDECIELHRQIGYARNEVITLRAERDAARTVSDMTDEENAKLRAELTKMSLSADMQRDTESMIRAERERNLESIRQGNDIITRKNAELSELKEQHPVAYGCIKTNQFGVLKCQGLDTPLYARPVPAIPDGYVLVPVEPNYQMKSAAMNVETEDYCLSFEEVTEIYRTMIAVAQKEVK